MDGTPALPEMISCARRDLRLTEAACARFWLSANPAAPPAWEGRFICHGCPAGAARCGQTINPMIAALAPVLAVCPRCTRQSDRIINGASCVSCYNRELEVRAGKNAKGRPPRLVARGLAPAAVMAIEGGLIERLSSDFAAGPCELALARTRRAKAACAFGWAPRPLRMAA